MNCFNCESLISAYIDDELDRARRREIEEHFDGCDRCRKEYETQLAAWDVATELSPDPPPDGLWDAIDSQLQQETSRTTLEDLTLIVRGLAGEVRDLRASVESLRADLRSEAVEEGPAPRDPLHPRLSVWEEAVSRRSRSGVG